MRIVYYKNKITLTLAAAKFGLVFNAQHARQRKPFDEIFTKGKFKSKFNIFLKTEAASLA